MTAQTLSARKVGARVPCPAPGCGYTMDSAGSVPAHVAMAHKDPDPDALACVGSNHVPNCAHFPATPAESPAAGVALLKIPGSDDQHWLDDRIARIEDGLDAVLDIAAQWTDGRNLARLHPGISAQDYILSRVKHPLGRGVVLPLLAESDWSQAQIARIAGVSTATVSRTVTDVTVDRPAETLGADGKYRPGRVVRTVVAEVIDTPPATDALAAGLKAAAVATVPERQRRRPPANPAHIVSTFCRMTSKSTGRGCQQPERWLMQPPAPAPMEVCQQHGKMLERQGWQFVRELHPVPGFDRDGRTLAAEA